MNALIHKIKEYIPNVSIKLLKNEEGELEIIFINQKAILTILKNNTWDEVKRNIDAKLKNIKECEVCLTNINTKIVSCNKCSKYVCYECYINIIKSNKGISKCPYCRFEIGEKMNEENLFMLISQISRRIN